MTTKLNSPFKRELEVNGEKYTLTVMPEGFRLVLKGKRKGVAASGNAMATRTGALAPTGTVACAVRLAPLRLASIR